MTSIDEEVHEIRRQWIWSGRTENCKIHRTRKARYHADFASDGRASGNFDKGWYNHRRPWGSSNDSSDFSIHRDKVTPIKHLTNSKALKDAILEEGAAFTPEMTKKKIRKFEDAKKQKLFLGPTLYNDRLRKTLDQMMSLGEEVPELLDDTEYDVDVMNCEKYIESAKRAIMRTSRQMIGVLVP